MSTIHNRKQRKNQPGSPSQEGEPSFLAAARVRRPFGVRGAVVIEVLTDFPHHLLQAAEVYVGEEHRKESVASIRRHGGDMVLAFAAQADRDDAERLRGQILYVRTDGLPPLPAGTYYLHQIEGLAAVNEAGERLGTVREILKTGANDVYVIRGERGEILLPAIPQVILAVRLAEGIMVVRLLEGLEWNPKEASA